MNAPTWEIVASLVGVLVFCIVLVAVANWMMNDENR